VVGAIKQVRKSRFWNVAHSPDQWFRVLEKEGIRSPSDGGEHLMNERRRWSPRTTILPLSDHQDSFAVDLFEGVRPDHRASYFSIESMNKIDAELEGGDVKELLAAIA
jgi:hypothetical protein